MRKYTGPPAVGAALVQFGGSAPPAAPSSDASAHFDSDFRVSRARGPEPLSLFQLASTSVDEDHHGFDQVGGAVGAAADLAEDLPALELGVGSLTGSALAGVRGVDVLLCRKQWPVVFAHRAHVVTSAGQRGRCPDQPSGRVGDDLHVHTVLLVQPKSLSYRGISQA